MEKQKLLYQQARLHNRGAAEMVLQTISASKGRIYPKFHRNTYILVIFKSNSIGKQILYYSEEFAEQKREFAEQKREFFRASSRTDDLPRA